MIVRILSVAGLVGCAALGGCGFGSNPTRFDDSIKGTGSTREVVGDWDDVEAAVDYGITEAEVAAVWPAFTGPSYRAITEDVVEYRLQSVDDEEGTLRITRFPAEGDAAGSVRMVLVARIGHSGNPARESALVLSVARRLKQLAGVGTALPLDE